MICRKFSSLGTRVVSGRKKLPGYSGTHGSPMRHWNASWP